MTYAVAWREGADPPYAGRLELTTRGLELAGTASTTRESRRKIFFDELVRVQVERLRRGERETRPALVLECRNGSRLEITPVAGPGTLHELTEQVSAGQRRAAERRANAIRP
jgi:hypothetical protein